MFNSNWGQQKYIESIFLDSIPKAYFIGHVRDLKFVMIPLYTTVEQRMYEFNVKELSLWPTLSQSIKDLLIPAFISFIPFTCN